MRANQSRVIRNSDKSKNFSIIPNFILQSTVLKPNEKSLLVHLLSMPDDWFYVKTKFWKKTNLGRNAFNNAWKGLEKHGFIKSERIMDGNLLRGYNYTISELPIFGNTEEWKNQELGNKQSTNKQINNKTKKELDKNSSPSTSSTEEGGSKSFSDIFYSNPNISAREYLNNNL